MFFACICLLLPISPVPLDAWMSGVSNGGMGGHVGCLWGWEGRDEGWEGWRWEGHERRLLFLLTPLALILASPSLFPLYLDTHNSIFGLFSCIYSSCRIYWRDWQEYQHCLLSGVLSLFSPYLDTLSPSQTIHCFLILASLVFWHILTGLTEEYQQCHITFLLSLSRPYLDIFAIIGNH